MNSVNVSNIDIPVIAIDGPSCSGKGVIGKLLAKKIGWNLLDSGAVYRFLAFLIIKNKIQLDNLTEILAIIKLLNIHDMEAAGINLRSEECGNVASKLAVIPEVRIGINIFLQSFKQAPGLVADGRDMGTVVFPDAKLKIFLTANVEERARRRFLQLQESGVSVKYEDILGNLIERDKRDESRLISPLKPDRDAVIINTTNLNINDTLQFICNLNI